MPTSEREWDWLQGEVRTASHEFASQLRQYPDMADQVPNLEWSVAELARHVIGLPSWFKTQNALERFEPPTDWKAYLAGAHADDDAADRLVLANGLEAAVEALLNACSQADEPRRLYGQATTAANTVAGMLAELKIHGMDLAALTGAEVGLSRGHALWALRQQMAITPAFIDQKRARAFDGTYHLSFRGGDHYTYLINDGVLLVRHGKPPRADAHLNADPVAFLLLSLGRMNPVKAGLKGKVVLYGRKPWKLAMLDKVKVVGV